MSLASTFSGNLLTAAGTESDRLTIRVRVDASALGTWGLTGETRRPDEPAPVRMGKRQSPTGQKLVRERRPRPGKSLKALKKTGGTDGLEHTTTGGLEGLRGPVLYPAELWARRRGCEMLPSLAPTCQLRCRI